MPDQGVRFWVEGHLVVMLRNCWLSGLLAAIFAGCHSVWGQTAGDQQATTDKPAGQQNMPGGFTGRGYELLTTKSYLPPDFDQQTFDEVWKMWEEPLRSRAAEALPDERRRMAFERYGLTSRPGDQSGKPQQYVVDEVGNWCMNCLACHQGQVAGQVIPGVSNSLFALETLTEEIRATKIRLGKKLTRMDLGLLVIPLGTTNGTTNAVNFGVALLARRDADLNIVDKAPLPKLVHHDHDAPAWWHMQRKQRIYCDAFADKNTRALMQFMLVKENGPEKFREWERDFEEVSTWIESLRAAYPRPIEGQLAAEGGAVFNKHCAACHGTYGADRSFPAKIVPIDEVGTDRVRLDSLTPEHRRRYAASWFNEYREDSVVADPGGYEAPLLDGVWATAPYFHNGSVPTLWHVLHPAERPTVWKHTVNGYDWRRVGVEMETFSDLPPEATRSNANRRRYFDTREFGKSAAGHLFPDKLSESEKRAVLEYLKTL